MTEAHNDRSAASESAVNELAAWLIALEDAEMYKPVWPSLIEHGRMYIHAALTEQHDGDCTKKPFTCVVCSGSDAIARAKQILGSLLPFVTFTDAQGSPETDEVGLEAIITDLRREKLRLCDALKNMMGVYDTPLSRRRFPPDEFMKAALESGRDALAAQPPAAPVETKPFHGAQCPSYPSCTGGCGLGCTHEVDQFYGPAPVETGCDCLPWPGKCPYCGGDAPAAPVEAGDITEDLNARQEAINESMARPSSSAGNVREALDAARRHLAEDDPEKADLDIARAMSLLNEPQPTPTREDVIEECASVADDLSDCSAIYIAGRIRDLALSRPHGGGK